MEDRKNRLEKDIKQVTLWCQVWSMMQGGYGTHIPLVAITNINIIASACNDVDVVVSDFMDFDVASAWTD
jgi:hypothetical protein